MGFAKNIWKQLEKYRSKHGWSSPVKNDDYTFKRKLPTTTAVFQKLYATVRRTEAIPAVGNRSRAVTLDKRNGKKKFGSIRVVHCMCALWKAFVAGIMVQGREEGQRLWPPYFHGFIPKRRREGAMAVARTTAARLRQQKIHFVECGTDLARAFETTNFTELIAAGQRLVSENKRSPDRQSHTQLCGYCVGWRTRSALLTGSGRNARRIGSPRTIS